MTRPVNQTFVRENFESLCRRRFIYAPAFDIYGGVSGLYDYGPVGCGLQSNIVDIWKKHFILEEDMLEVDCTALTPHEVLKTSGHVEKFADWMCKDPKSGEIFRADHLVEEVLESRLKGDKEARGLASAPVDPDATKAKRKKKVHEIQAVALTDQQVSEYETILAKIDGYSGPELGELIKQHKITNPATGQELLPPNEFNLMFETSIGPTGQLKGYLRPETAQGQFLNFSKLLEYNHSKMPFASASVGKSFRNEISPRAGLLRVREFLMAEIEHFVDPKCKNHPRFKEVSHLEIAALPKDVQLAGSTEIKRISLKEAVETKVIDNETLGYFIGRIYLFMLKIGVDPKRMRFRQHMANEMAHYAADCWDCELHTSYGWIECVGCADRSAYDLSVHSARTKEKLVVREAHSEPITVEAMEVEIDRKKFGPKFRKDAGKIEEWLVSRGQDELECLASEMSKLGLVKPKIDGVEYEIDSSLAKFEKRVRKEHVREYTPNVIEPSFGLGRILYSLLEHCYYTRPEDETRPVFAFKPAVASTKVLIVPLSGNPQFDEPVQSVIREMRRAALSAKVDDSSASIGKRYARNDEIGTPFGVTVDFQTLKDNTITLRERDSTNQVRADVASIVAAVRAMVFNHQTWEEATKALPKFDGQELD